MYWGLGVINSDLLYLFVVIKFIASSSHKNNGDWYLELCWVVWTVKTCFAGALFGAMVLCGERTRDSDTQEITRLQKSNGGWE